MHNVDLATIHLTALNCALLLSKTLKGELTSHHLDAQKVLNFSNSQQGRVNFLRSAYPLAAKAFSAYLSLDTDIELEVRAKALEAAIEHTVENQDFWQALLNNPSVKLARQEDAEVAQVQCEELAHKSKAKGYSDYDFLDDDAARTKIDQRLQLKGLLVWSGTDCAQLLPNALSAVVFPYADYILTSLALETSLSVPLIEENLASQNPISKDGAPEVVAMYDILQKRESSTRNLLPEISDHSPKMS